MVVGTGLLLIAVLAVLVVSREPDGPEPLTGADVGAAVADGIEQAQEDERNLPTDASVAYQRILPSLVTVATRRPDTEGTDGGTGLGAGVVVNADGAVLTALHVVDAAGPAATDETAGGTEGSIEVTFADGTRADAQIVTRQDENDMAVLAVHPLPEVVVPAVLGGAVRVGDAVFPVGNPLGLRASLSAGVVSALDRSVTTDDGSTLSGLIQFDAAVNPGNSGGPLLDRDGRVVGIVTGLANPSDEARFVGVGFAVPIATAGGAAGGPQK